MRRLDVAKLNKTALNRLGAEAEKVTYTQTRPLTTDARKALARASAPSRRTLMKPTYFALVRRFPLVPI